MAAIRAGSSEAFGIYLTLLIGPKIPLPAPAPLIEALQSVEVTSTDSGRDGFQLIFTIGRSGQGADNFEYSLLKGLLLKPFNRVIIIVSLGPSRRRVLIDGLITHQQLSPSNEPGQSTLSIIGEDVSVVMDLEEKSQTHPNQPDVSIVGKIILSYAEYGLVPFLIPPVSAYVPIVVDHIPSQQGTDLYYILEMARSHDYVFFIEPTDVPGVNKAYWGPPILTGIPQKALSINMGPATNTISINFQYSALKPNMISGSVQDRNTNTKIPIITLGSSRNFLSSRPAILSNLPNVRTKKFRASGLNTQQAYLKAQAQTDESMDSLTASGEIDALRYGDILRARKLVGLRGTGQAHDGLYYVKSVTHKIKRGEYRQNFTLSREGLGSLVSKVIP